MDSHASRWWVAQVGVFVSGCHAQVECNDMLLTEFTDLRCYVATQVILTEVHQGRRRTFYG